MWEDWYLQTRDESELLHYYLMLIAHEVRYSNAKRRKPFNSEHYVLRFERKDGATNDTSDTSSPQKSVVEKTPEELAKQMQQLSIKRVGGSGAVTHLTKTRSQVQREIEEGIRAEEALKARKIAQKKG